MALSTDHTQALRVGEESRLAMVREGSVPKVLVVDDDQGLSTLIQKVLRAQDYAAVCVTSGQQAIAWLSRNDADLMLLDLKLHDIEGKELVNHLVDINRFVPFIIITGQGDERVAVDMMKRGALDYLVKDLDFLQFIPEVVRQALAHLADKQRLVKAEAALIESDTRFRLTADQAPVLIWMSGPDKGYTWFNRPWLEFTGRSMEEQLGIGWVHGVHLEDRHRCLVTYVRSFTARKPFATEYRLRRYDGEWRWVLDTGVPLYVAESEFTGYIGSCIDITERRRLEKEVLEISDWEQRRIAQDIHDGLGQQLTAVKLLCESLKCDLASAGHELQGQVAQVCQLLRDAIKHARSLAHDLAAFKVEHGGLQRALTDLAEVTSSLGHTKCRLECVSPPEPEDDEVATHLYRIAQEAVNNAVKHSRADEVIIRLSRHTGLLRMEVADNGTGLPRTPRPNYGMGLRLMEHRAGVIGANLEVQSRTGRGVTVRCTLRGRK